MKSPKNCQVCTSSHLNGFMSPQNKTRTLSRTKVSNEGHIRKQVISPSPVHRWQDDTKPDETVKGTAECLSPTNSNSRVRFDIENQNTHLSRNNTTKSKLQQILTMASTQELRYRRKKMQTIQDDLMKKIEINQWQSKEIDQVKLELQKSYKKLKQLQKRHKDAQKKMQSLEQTNSNLEKQIKQLKRNLYDKDDLIQQLEQKIHGLQYNNDLLHKNLNGLQLSLVDQRNNSIQILKEHLLRIQKDKTAGMKENMPPSLNVVPPYPCSKITSSHIIEVLPEQKVNQFQLVPQTSLVNSNLSANSPTSINNPEKQIMRWKSEVQQLRSELDSKAVENQQKQSKLRAQRDKMKDELNIMTMRMQQLKSMNPVEIRKEKEREDLYLLYIQAVSIENLLQLKDAST